MRCVCGGRVLSSLVMLEMSFLVITENAIIIVSHYCYMLVL